MARSYPDYTTVTFLKAEKRQNNSPCDAEPLTEPSSKVRRGSSSLSSAKRPNLAVFCCFLLLCLLSSSPRLQCCSLSWLSMLKVWRRPMAFTQASSTDLFQRCSRAGMGWDVDSQNWLGHVFLLPIPLQLPNDFSTLWNSCCCMERDCFHLYISGAGSSVQRQRAGCNSNLHAINFCRFYSPHWSGIKQHRMVTV